MGSGQGAVRRRRRSQQAARLSDARAVEAGVMRVDRRTVFATGAAAALSTAWPAYGEESKPPIIDCHTHFYDPSRPGGVPWPGKDDKVLYRTVLPKQFREVAGPLGVTGTVVVEASPLVEDNQWLL